MQCHVNHAVTQHCRLGRGLQDVSDADDARDEALERLLTRGHRRWCAIVNRLQEHDAPMIGRLLHQPDPFRRARLSGITGSLDRLASGWVGPNIKCHGGLVTGERLDVTDGIVRGARSRRDQPPFGVLFHDLVGAGATRRMGGFERDSPTGLDTRNPLHRNHRRIVRQQKTAEGVKLSTRNGIRGIEKGLE